MTLLSVCFYSLSSAEEIRFDHIQTSDGLSSENILSFCRDYLGFLWIGTEDGLNKYDGYSFEIFRHKTGDSTSLCSNNIHYIFEDSKNNLWICAWGGLSIYNREKNTFRNIQHEKNDDPSSLNAWLYMIEDSKNNYWISTSNNGLYKLRYNQETGEAVSVQFLHDPSNPKSLSSNNIFYLAEDPSGKIWVGTRSSGLDLLDPETGEARHFRNDPNDPESISSDFISYLKMDSKNRLWIGTADKGLDLYIEDQAFINYNKSNGGNSGLPNEQVWAVEENPDGTIWVGTDEGLCRFVDASRMIPENSFFIYKHRQSNPYSLLSNSIKAVYTDNYGDMYISSYYGGINTYNKNKYKFNAYFFNAENTNIPSSNIITAITNDKQGNFWIGIDDGGIIMVPKDGEKSDFKNFAHYYHKENTPGSLTNNKIKSLTFDSKGILWVGLWNGGVNYFDPKEGVFHNLNKQHPLLNNISSIAVDKNDNLWISTFFLGVIYYNRENNTFRHFNQNDGQISHNHVHSVFIDRNDNVWAGTIGSGACKFDPVSEKFMPLLKNGELMTGKTINVIFEDSEKRIWFGTNGNGAQLYDPVSDTVYTFPVLTKNSSNSVYAIEEDNFGYLWMTNNNGLFKLNPETGNVQCFNTTDGLPGNQFIYRSSLATKNGMLLFGSSSGLAAFYPNDITLKNIAVPIAFTDFKVNNIGVTIDPNSVLKKHISLTEEITLKPSQNSFSIEFAGLNLTTQYRNQYAYMLENLQNEWQYIDSKNSAIFTNIDPGVYTFRLKVSSDGSNWFEKPEPLKITVLPVWWRTNTFKFVLIFCIIALIFLLYRIRFKFLVKQKKVLLGKVEERTKEIKNVNKVLEDSLREIQQQNVILKRQRAEIHNKNVQIKTQYQNMIDFNEKLLAQNEEIVTQNEKIHDQNLALELAHMQLKNVNEQLERKVKNRTDKFDVAIKELYKTVSELDRFVYSASHDLSAPVKSILDLVKLADEERDPKKINEYLHLIKSSILKQEEVIENLVQYSRNSRLSITMEEICMYDFLEDIFNELKYLPGAKNVTFNLHMEKDFCIISDKQRLHIIFHNLIANAIKYRNPLMKQSTIDIINKSDQHSISFDIRDNGIGIKEENFEKIFEMFFRASDNSSGSGLGLYLVKETIQKLKGNISVSSSAGKGSVFSITLPRLGYDS